MCHNVVAAAHLVPIVDLLRDRDDIELFVTNDHFPAQEISKSGIQAIVRARYSHTLASLLVDWNLVIYVNHAWGFGAWLAPCLTKVYINHGLYIGKINNKLGEDGVYGYHRTTRPHRGLLYDRMFAASSSERDAALAADPGLADVVVVTGSLMADHAVEASSNRDAIRARLGFKPGDQLIHVISTWGSASLAATVGEELLSELARCGRTNKVLLSVHPRFDKFGGVNVSRKETLDAWASLGAMVDEDNTLWVDFVAASDVAIADHSSLALYHCVFRKPVVHIPVAAGAYLEGSPFDRLRRSGIRLSSMNAVDTVVEHALRVGATCPSEEVDRLAQHVGAAAARHTLEIDRLLNC